MALDTGNNYLPDDLPQRLAYDNVTGLLSTVTVTDGTSTWVRSYSYDTAGRSTYVSGWVKQ